MADLQLLDCFQPELVRLERVRFFQRQLLLVADLVTEQDYFRQKLRRHNRFLHGWGVVCGLEVVPQPTEDAPWRVEITAGYALGPYGDEVYVGDSAFLDLALCGPDALTSPCEPDVLEGPSEVSGGTLYVAIKYAECLTQPVRAMPAGCACDDIACEYSRIRDSFELSCLTELPPSPTPLLLCDLIAENSVAPCPPCQEDPWVVLASVTLPAPGVDLEVTAIDNMVRRSLFSTALLQEQLIACCCGEPQPQLSADLVVRKTSTSQVGPAGRLITYVISVRNNGPSAAQNVVVNDTFDITNGTASAVAGDPLPQGQWTQGIGPLNPPQTHHAIVANLGTVPPSPAALELRFTVTVRLTSGTLGVVNTAVVTSSTADPNSANNSISIQNLWPPE